ncbi:hypothetical protein M378DRAFT_565228 [Amanita muscaria Koide BX008]|uniref:Uncharacterized protein n=1 Tax=Amanita muscaria (strain Koide BX008) TaxID=946122 RepID=A0A0C2X7V3_AMAMK|nr:hypothetical protein M378DRAFT_565228 [Amanita muscaria Koide BX008]
MEIFETPEPAYSIVMIQDVRNKTTILQFHRESELRCTLRSLVSINYSYSSSSDRPRCQRQLCPRPHYIQPPWIIQKVNFTLHVAPNCGEYNNIAFSSLERVDGRTSQRGRKASTKLLDLLRVRCQYRYT